MSSLTTALSQANAAASTLDGTLSTGSTGSSSSGAPTGNFDTLLQLLTPLLLNQDPLDPLDTNQFIDTPPRISHTDSRREAQTGLAPAKGTNRSLRLGKF